MGRPSKKSFDESYKINKENCWVWIGGITRKGYGCFCIENKNVRAHRYSYERTIGKIPKNLVIDHLCRNRKCVNPTHLEVVTNKENVLRGNGVTAKNARKTHCKRGHPLSGDNLRIIPLENKVYRGWRICKECQRQHIKNFKIKQKNLLTAITPSVGGDKEGE